MATRTVPPSGENEIALSMRLLMTCASRLSWPVTIGAYRPWRFSRTTSTLRLAARSFWIDTIVSASFSTSTRSAVSRASSASSRRGVGDVGDQPVEAAHVVLDDGVEPLAVLGPLGARQRLDRAAQRGQRVLELMRDVGGEALDRLDAVVERVGHRPQRAAEVPDLVGAVGEIGDLGARVARATARPRPPRRAGASDRRWCRRAAARG